MLVLCIPQRWWTLILFAVPVLLGGCGDPGSDQYIVRVHEVRCEAPEAFADTDKFRCKGRTVESGTYEYRLVPKADFAIVRVVKLGNGVGIGNTSVYKVEGCAVWDALNWQCANKHPFGNGTFEQSYECVGGRYSRVVTITESNKTIISDERFTGSVEDISPVLTRLMSKFR